MKFGVFCNPMVPRADAFLGEHHFMPEYAHNSATEVLPGALAARAWPRSWPPVSPG